MLLYMASVVRWDGLRRSDPTETVAERRGFSVGCRLSAPLFIDIVDKWVRDVQAVVHGIIDCASKEGMSIPDEDAAISGAGISRTWG